MKVVGIIAEYNPFHNGHKYQLDQLKEKTGADYIIIAMSGNFLQRGVPALCDKHTRTKMALSCGADLVLELPTLWATASAEYFAQGGVKLLEHTGVVTHLGFGAETDNLRALSSLSSILMEEPTEYKEHLNVFLKKGLSFPSARKEALLETLKNHQTLPVTFDLTEINHILDLPNNILALEYLKALPNHMTPVLIPRKGAGYHDTDLTCALPSATAIRNAILSDATSTTATMLCSLEDAMPTESAQLLCDCIKQNRLIDVEDFSEILGYCLLSNASNGYEAYADCSLELSNKIRNNLKAYCGWNDFCQNLKSKDLTYTRISRTLLHIMLNITPNDYALGKRLNFAPYLRVLGFRKSSSDLLSAIKKEARVPMITKVSDAASLLSKDEYLVFEKDLYASSIYHQLLTVKKKQPPANDFTNQIVIL